MMISPSPKDNSYRISSRYINIRDGAQDYELLRMVAEKSPATAQAIAARVARDFSDFTSEEIDLAKARQLLLEAAQAART